VKNQPILKRVTERLLYGVIGESGLLVLQPCPVRLKRFD